MAAEATLQPIRRFGFDAAILFADILLVPDALGQGVRLIEGDGPRLDAIRSDADLARWQRESGVAFVRGAAWRWPKSPAAAFAHAVDLLQGDIGLLKRERVP